MSPLPAVPDDPSNAVAENDQAARLGELLFFDLRLSPNGERSCATCHDPNQNWTDGQRVASPSGRFPKNTPSLWNTAYNRWFFWNGRADSAWSQALAPIENEAEMGSNRLRVAHHLSGDPELRTGYEEVFGPFPQELDDQTRFPANAKPVPEEPENPLHQAWIGMSREDRHAANIVFANAGKAIAAFERALVTTETPFDRWVSDLEVSGESVGQSLHPSSEFPVSALRGLKLFVGRGQCTLCHSGPLFSDGEFHDVGIALGDNMKIDPGRHRGVLTLLDSSFTRIGPYSDEVEESAAINYLELQGHQLGQFKTPSLRGVAETAPYMHDGRFDTLEDVVRFYSTREGARPLGHPTSILEPLGLNDQQLLDLVSFLNSLSHERPAPPSF